MRGEEKKKYEISEAIKRKRRKKVKRATERRRDEDQKMKETMNVFKKLNSKLNT